MLLIGGFTGYQQENTKKNFLVTRFCTLSMARQGVGQVNNMVKTVIGLDRMKCGSRLACEYMANR